MLNKLLNPFNINLTEASKGWVVLGMLVSFVFHTAFYYTLFHFIHKYW